MPKAQKNQWSGRYDLIAPLKPSRGDADDGPTWPPPHRRTREWIRCVANEIGPDVVKHLEFIQATITRLNNASFLIKGWAMTVTAGIVGLAASQKDLRICGAGLLPLASFWLLDSYFLRQERLYRHLYDDVRREKPEVERFSMNATKYKEAVPLLKAAASPLLLTFYGTPFLILSVLTVVGP